MRYFDRSINQVIEVSTVDNKIKCVTGSGVSFLINQHEWQQYIRLGIIVAQN